MIKEAISQLVLKQDLTREESAEIMEEIMEGQATQAQLGAFLTALRMKGETGGEISGLADVMRAKSIPVKVEGPLLDIVGTGGDGLNTFNISTAAAIVAAGAGVKVAKHGSRAATSKTGSADVLEKLGVRIDLTSEQVADCIRHTGIGFMFAHIFHPAMKHVAGVRREIGIRTVFNILGPLANPARPDYVVLGVASLDLMEKMTYALIQLNIRHALVVHGLNGMDEISVAGATVFHEIKGKQVTPGEITPEMLGLHSWPLVSIQSEGTEERAKLIRQVLQGIKGPHRDAVVMNTAAGLMAVEKACSWQEAVKMAEESIDSGQANKTLERMIEFTQKLAGGIK